MKLRKVLVSYTKPVTKEDHLSFSEVKNVLGKYKIKASIIERNNLTKKKYIGKNIIIALGGDGTFLKTALHIKNSIPILGVNSDTSMKEGFFMKADRNDFDEKIQRILDDKFTIQKLSRLQAKVNNKILPCYALNEFYFGSDKEYITSRYYLKIGRTKERHRSSGILVATPAGSHAWISSCGGKKLKLNSKKFEYVVREPYQGKRNGKVRLRKGILGKDSMINITSDMSRGVLVADSIGTEYRVKKYDKVEIKLTDKDLNVVFF